MDTKVHSEVLFQHSKEKKDLFTLSRMIGVKAKQKDLDTLIEIMERKSESFQVLFLASHITSDFALDEDNVDYLNNHRICDILSQGLDRFHNNQEIVYKLTSALWNLCRPGYEEIIPPNLVKQVLMALIKNKDSKNVVHTCIGCLSNLCLAIPEVFHAILTPVIIEELLLIVLKYSDKANVMCYFGSLVANMAINDYVAETCILSGYLGLCIKNLYNFKQYELRKYNIAAIHNLSDVQNFYDFFALNEGLEIVLKLREEYSHDTEIFSYINGLFGEGKIPEFCTNSLHLAAGVCKFSVFQQMFSEGRLHCIQSIDKKDLEGDSAFEKAVQYGREDVVEFLASLGAHVGNASSHLPHISPLEDRFMVAGVIINGVRTRMAAKTYLKNGINGVKYLLHEDLWSIVTTFISPFDLLHTYLESKKNRRTLIKNDLDIDSIHLTAQLHDDE